MRREPLEGDLSVEGTGESTVSPGKLLSRRLSVCTRKAYPETSPFKEVPTGKFRLQALDSVIRSLPGEAVSIASPLVSVRQVVQTVRGVLTMTRTRGIAATVGVMALALAAESTEAGPAENVGHGFAPVSGTRLFYEVRGAGPALVFIHGGQLDCRMWDEQFAAFSQHFRVIGYDVRGYGGSFRPDMPYSDAADLAALLDYLKVDKAHLVGLSLGGRIAVDFALAYPTRVRSLTLAGPGLSGYEPPGGAESDLRMWEIIKTARDAGPEQATALWLKDPFMAPAMEQARLAPILRRIALENAHCWLGNPVLQRPPKPAAATRLGEIKVPTLLVIGDRDVPQIEATVETLERGIGGAKRVLIRGAGHMVNMENPVDFNNAVLEFLRGQEPRPDAPPPPAGDGARPTLSRGPSAAAQVLHVAEMTTGAIRGLDRMKTVVLLPGGILEEHGPYLPAYTDGILSERLTRELARAIAAKKPDWKVLVFPQIPLGASGSNELGGHFVFPGTYAVRPATLRAVFMDLAAELGEQGFRWIIVVNVHGAPLHNRALDQASHFFRDTYGGRMVHLWGLVPVLGGWGRALAGRNDAEKKEDGVSLHAGMDETSLLLHLRPDLVAPAYQQAPVVTGHSLEQSFAVARAADWPGYLGSPRLASANLGETIWKSFTSAAVEHVLSILDGVPPEKYARYADLLQKRPLYQRWIEEAEAHADRLEAKQQQWLRKNAP
jgi:pimeloyl-ACP methyl ester carboxylesterase/creatinine amidohydrolase/Fe(II)-dependent formamide hydrolase-like protein